MVPERRQPVRLRSVLGMVPMRGRRLMQRGALLSVMRPSLAERAILVPLPSDGLLSVVPVRPTVSPSAVGSASPQHRKPPLLETPSGAVGPVASPDLGQAPAGSLSERGKAQT